MNYSPFSEKFVNYKYSGGKANQNKNQAGAPECGKGLIIAQQRKYGVEDKDAVPQDIYLGRTSLGSLGEIYWNFNDPVIALDCLEGQFRFYFKSAAQHRKAFHNLPAECPVSREDISDTHPEERIQKEIENSVPCQIKAFETAG